MEDLRWACQAVNLRQVRSSLAMAKPRSRRGSDRCDLRLSAHFSAQRSARFLLSCLLAFWHSASPAEPSAKRPRSDSSAAAAAASPLDISEPDPLAGSTVLHFACNPAVGTASRAHLPVLRLLLNHGASGFIDTQNNVGDTPLIVAARQGDVDGCKLLLEAEADPSIKNRFGDTVLHVACRLGHGAILLTCFSRFTHFHGDSKGQVSATFGDVCSVLSEFR